jgi:hypothetical protein
MWNNDGTVLAEEMLGKAVRSLLEQKVMMNPVSIYNVSVTMDQKISELIYSINLNREDEKSIQRRPNTNEKHKMHGPVTL